MFGNFIQLDYGDEKVTSTVKKHPLGTVGVTPDGNAYRYALCGASDIAAGRLVAAAAALTVIDMDITLSVAAAVGDETIYPDSSSATLDFVKDYFEDGYVFINAGAVQGFKYKIKSHPAVDASADPTFNLKLYPNDKVRVAIATTNELGLTQSPYKSVIISPTTPDAIALGWTTTNVTAAYYCWLQVSGIVDALIEGTVVKGESVRRSTTTAGAVTPNAATQGTISGASLALTGQVGYVYSSVVSVTTDSGLIYATIG